MGQQLSACTGADREEYLREYERRQESERAFDVLNRPVVVAKDGGAAIAPAQPHARSIAQQARMGSAATSSGARPLGARRHSDAGESLAQDEDIDQLYDVAVSHVITHLQTQGAHAGPGGHAAAGSFARKSDLSNEYIGAVGSAHGLGPAPQPSWHRLTSIAHPPDDTLAIAKANMPHLPPSAPASVEASRRSSNAAAADAAAAERSLYEAHSAAAAAPYDPLSASADLAAAANASHALRWKPRFGSAVTSLAKTTPIADGTHAPTESAEERAARKAAKRARRMEREEALRSSLAAQKTQLLGGGSDAGAKAASPSNAAPVAARAASSSSQPHSSFDSLRNSGRNPSVDTGSSPTAAAQPPAQEAKESMQPAHARQPSAGQPQQQQFQQQPAAVPIRTQSHARQQSSDRAPSNAQPQAQQQQQPSVQRQQSSQHQRQQSQEQLQQQHQSPPALKLHARKVSYFQESEDEDEDRFDGAPMVLGRHSTPKVRAASGSPPMGAQSPHAQPLRI